MGHLGTPAGGMNPKWIQLTGTADPHKPTAAPSQAAIADLHGPIRAQCRPDGITRPAPAGPRVTSIHMGEAISSAE